jgi:hypothetical protein
VKIACWRRRPEAARPQFDMLGALEMTRVAAEVCVQVCSLVVILI